MEGNLYSLRNEKLPLELLFKLAPFVNSYRPHDDIPISKDLRDEGYKLIHKETFVDQWESEYVERYGVTPEEKVESEEE